MARAVLFGGHFVSSYGFKFSLQLCNNDNPVPAVLSKQSPDNASNAKRTGNSTEEITI